MRILLIGAGAIGATVAKAADGIEGIDAVLAFDVRAGAAEALAARCRKTRAVASFEAGIASADVVVEAASQEAVAAFVPRALRDGKDAVVVSVGAFADDALRAEVERAAREAGRRVLVPSGAIGGLDALRAAREAKLASVTLTTSKPPAGLGRPAPRDGAPITLFEGAARDAVRAFPKNVNVAAALSLAGVGLDATRVRVVADPGLDRNVHVIEASGDFGSFRMEVRNEPFPENPATSHLAALSVIALLRRLVDPIQVGA